MPVTLWGVSREVSLNLPNRAVGYLLLLFLAALFAYLIIHFRPSLQRFTRRQWAWVTALAVAGLFFSQFLPLKLGFVSPPIVTLPASAAMLLALIPLLLAGVLVGPSGALLVGAATGLGVALGQTHQLFAVFSWAFTAVCLSFLLQQHYSGRIYHWLRQPWVAGLLGGLLLTVWSGIGTFVSVPVSGLSALDQALVVAAANFWPRLLEGLVAGGVVMFILRNVPDLRPSQPLIPPPTRRSLQKRLQLNYFTFAALLILLSITVVYNLAISVSTRLVVKQMAYNTSVVAAEIPEFVNQLDTQLTLFEADQQALLSADTAVARAALVELSARNPSYQKLLLVDASGEVTAVFPTDSPSTTLSDDEKTAVAQAFAPNPKNVALANMPTDEQVLSLVVPISAADGQTNAVLIGRLANFSLEDLLVGLQGTVGGGTGFLVNEQAQIIAHPQGSYLRASWPGDADELRRLWFTGMADGQAYRGWLQGSDTRELVYTQTVAEPGWTVVTAVPYEIVLGQALQMGWPLLLVLLLGTALFYTNVALLGRDITQPINKIVAASKTMAAGGSWNATELEQREDEIGELNQAFIQMQRATRKQLNDLSLLLGTSHDVSTSIDLNQGIPAILRGALRGTGAAGARAVVLNPSGGNPLSFGEGPAAEAMKSLDRPIMTRLRHMQELMLATPNQIRAALGLDKDAEPPVPALVAIPLYSHDRFQGILWLGYRQAHSYDISERNLLVTLATQTAVLVENARLFATAEGGRRRLAAVLASTTDAVIVTDQTERILLINRATERIFDLNASKVTGRPVAKVIEPVPLVKALTGDDEHTRNLEVPMPDGKTYYASASTIISNEGQIFGRVAVLRDITHLKEIDEMKSDFVATVSHDLRSPLTYMRGYATMVPMVDELSPKQHEYLDKILAGIDQMSQLVDDLLDLGRIEAGVDLAKERIEVKPLLEEIATEYWQHAHLAGIKLHVDVPEDIPAITGDGSLLRQAITNLLGNGIKYAPNSGPMWLRAEHKNGELVLSVQDSGPGIPKQDQMRLFEKFYRVKQRGTEKVKGSGLGLAIVRSIAERHGGRAWCISQQGEGCTFSLSVPVSQNGYRAPGGVNGAEARP
ncbi:MAG: PAS domain S-box protein [Ardenticatenaceae bacterium]|nr:PAS domain S-box protein [Anaerolineales bacterium]MCB8939637.1 PAS domain S-box protein [Ardenticatenaceae bacterium]MCB8974938.1 PAS domain S-box protein [Ardenticatenaceae bacterium]